MCIADISKEGSSFIRHDVSISRNHETDALTLQSSCFLEIFVLGEEFQLQMECVSCSAFAPAGSDAGLHFEKLY